MPRRHDELLEIKVAVAERRLGLCGGTRERLVEVLGLLHQAHPLAPAPRGRLEEDRIADLGGRAAGVRKADHLGPGHKRHAGLRKLALCLDLVAHPRHHVGVGPDEHEVVVLARMNKVGVL